MEKQVPPQNRAALLEPRERFPTRVTSVERLSPALQAMVQPYQSGENTIIRIPSGLYPFQRMLWKISLPFGWRRTPERVMVFDPEAITVVEHNTADGVITTSIPRASLLKIHLSVTLLYSYIELVWVDGDHVKTKAFEYNTVGELLILQGVNRLRAVYTACLPPAPVEEREDILAPLPFKFRNYLRDSLLPDEPLCAAVYQPAIRQGIGPFRPAISPNRAVGITDRQVILIEDRRDNTSTEVDYTIWRGFYPLSRIQHMEVEARPDVTWLRLQHGSASVIQTTDIPLMLANAEALWSVLQDHTACAV